MKKSKLPRIESVDKMAEFWDGHDLTDFDGELEEVAEPMFARKIKRHLDVRFEFLSACDKPRILRGTVVLRDNEMVLDVELPGDRPYCIKGKERGGYFEGVHDGLADDVPVHAKWTRLDKAWIGKWVEGGIDWFFTFELPSTRKRSR